MALEEPTAVVEELHLQVEEAEAVVPKKIQGEAEVDQQPPPLMKVLPEAMEWTALV